LATRFKVRATADRVTAETDLIQMEDQIQSALAGKDYALAQALADDWLSREPDLATAHYFAGWSRDAQGLEADAVIHYAAHPDGE
jgi:hypothetical protein